MAGKIIEVFKTDVQDAGDSDELVQKLTACLPGSKVNFDLEDCDNVLRVEAENFTAERIIRILNNCGYNCELLL